MKPALLLLASVAFFAGCGPESLTLPPPGPRGATAAVVPAAAHDESDGGCGGAPQVNDPICPTAWAGARALCSSGARCPVLEQACYYPNAGDGLADGTWATALLLCTDLHALEAGLDAGTGIWTCAQ